MRLLERDGWVRGRQAQHGIFFSRRFADDDIRTTVIPNKRGSLKPPTLNRILGPKQTGIGDRDYGLRTSY